MNAASDIVPVCRRVSAALLTTLALIAVALALPAHNAEAGSRNIGIGAGIVGGAILLKELSKAGKTTKKKSIASKKTTKKTATAKKKSGNSTASKSDGKSRKSANTEESAEPASTGETPRTATAAPAAPSQVVPAASGTAALAAKGVTASAANGTPEAKAISSKSEIKAAQEHLKYMGYDVPEVDGTLGIKTKIAMMQFQDSIGEPSTGILTTKQLQTLFIKVSEKTATAK